MGPAMRAKFLALCAVVVLAFTETASAVGFDIDLRLRGRFSDSQQRLFFDAERYWESVITGYQPGITIPKLKIVAAAKQVDGRSGVLGFAGPTVLASKRGFIVPKEGELTLDKDDLATLENTSGLGKVIMHEFAHIMGFGALWAANDAYKFSSGRYVGPSGLAAYRAEFDPAADFVPVELDGGAGTRNFHWAENWAGGTKELMTGFFDTPTFVSRTTIASFQDIGYRVGSSVAPVPLPFSAPLTIIAFAALVAAARVSRRG